MARFLLTRCTLLAAFLSAVPCATAQVRTPAFEEVLMSHDTGFVQNDTDEWAVVASFPVSVPNADWVRLYFEDVQLAGDVFRGTGSILRILGHEDGGEQLLNEIHVGQWRESSCYFNGTGVLVEIWAAPGTGPNRVKLRSVKAGITLGHAESQCGPTDDRVASSDPRACRLLPIGCTGWLIDDCARCFLTAGHCNDLGGGVDTAQFNVPLSDPNGQINHPPPQDQYPVDATSEQYVNAGVGDDWGYFGAFANSNTGLTAAQAQGSTYLFRPAPSFDPAHDIRITGYGADSGSANQTQQTHVGPLATVGGDTIGYVTDTEGGNSGSPVIWEQTGEAVGIHCHGGCSAGNNWGSTYANAGLQNALANPQGICECVLELLTPPPSQMTPGQSDSFNVGVGSNLIGSPTLFVRYDGGNFVPVQMLQGAPEVWQAVLPPPVCGATVEFYVSADTTAGTLTLPETAPAALFTATVGAQALVTTDTLEAPSGWTVGAPADSATSGIWTRVDPVGTSAQPEDDHTPAGTTCFVTGQGSVGGADNANDVDGGRTSLHTPVLDLSGFSDPVIAYWLWFSSEGTDPFRVHVSDDAGSTWTLVEIFDGDGAFGNGGWFRHEVRVADFVTPNDQVQLRFRAQDTLNDHLVEAAVDDLEVLEVSCDVILDDCNANGILDSDDIASGRSFDFNLDGIPDECPTTVGTALCFGDGSGASCPCGNDSPAAGRGCLHSGGVGMRIEGSGSTSISADNLILTASDCPVGNTGIFYVGTSDLSPGSALYDGLQCAGGDVRRFRGLVQVTGSISDTDFVAQDPSGFYFNAGTSYSFQFWTRDVAGGPTPCGTNANFSPALRVTMTP